ncbi:hypothetical protein R1flu_016379 [Riccia fluitans]|uniref:Uncharacterized protein n=1 Tax=Riccia fluitans TaxID=41844 RepID=A0ABD1YLW6_9MARC
MRISLKVFRGNDTDEIVDSQGMDLGRKIEDDLSDISTPRSEDSDLGRAQQVSDVQDLPVSRGGDRVMSRRSLQQATSGDIFGRPPSPYHAVAAGRLSSASENSESTTLHDALGPGSQGFTQDIAA